MLGMKEKKNSFTEENAQSDLENGINGGESFGKQIYMDNGH